MAETLEVKVDFEVTPTLKFKKGEVKSFSDAFIEKYGDNLKEPSKPKKEKKEE